MNDKRIGDHAVVLGGSMAGLLAARVLADVDHRVTVVERDDLRASTEPRRGVPLAVMVLVEVALSHGMN